MTNPPPLAGKTALVTGAASGIGAETAFVLAGAGAVVVIADVKEDARAVIERIEAGGGRAVFKRLDVADFEAAQGLIKGLAAEFGGLYLLVNNAGVTRDQVLGRMKPDQWKRVIDVNLGGCFNCCRAASRVMIKQGEGRIVNVSSVVARTGNVGQANYAASKAGIEGLTRSMALELGRRGVTVNAVAPGFIDTEMTRALPAPTAAEVLARVPLGRPGKAADVAAAVLFLAGPGAAYITGQTLHVNGGLYCG